MEYQIIDNFLSEEDFNRLRDTLLNPSFPWNYNPRKVFKDKIEEEPYDFQFVHNFFIGSQKVSEYFDLVQPIFDKLNMTGYARTKANITPRTDTRVVYDFHTDFKYPPKLTKTGILYINTNNGPTIFEGGLEVEAIANRFVTFDSNILHAGSSCTNQNIRCVVNVNYFIPGSVAE